jgi:hypothetical protein
MDNSAIAKFTLDEAAWLGMHSAYFRLKRNRLFWVVAGVATTACVLLGVFVLLKMGKLFTGSFFILLPVWLCFERLVFRRSRLKKSFAKLPQRGREVSWSFSASKVVSDDNHSRSETEWSDFVQVAHGHGWLLLFIQADLYIGIPVAAFASNEDFERAIVMATSNGLKVIRIP